MTPVRVGVFGGAFDPPHNAHVALARCAVSQLGLSELRVLPTGDAWHKVRALTDAAHRLAMARLAFEEIGAAVVDEREIRRTGPTYTLDTLRELQHERPGAELVLVIGTDQAAALPAWHGWRDILAMAVVAVAGRPDATEGVGGDTVRFAPESWPELPAGARFETLALPAMDISATDIRSRMARGAQIADLVPPAVARYIAKHNLYSANH